MHSYKLLPHTADVRLEVTANNLEEVFQAALQGMSELMKHNFCTTQHEHQVEENIHVTGPDLTGLLIDFLSEVLTLSQIGKVIFCTVRLTELTSRELKGLLTGYAVDDWDEDIKAVTYHEAALGLNEQGQWRTNIIFDI